MKNRPGYDAKYRRERYNRDPEYRQRVIGQVTAWQSKTDYRRKHLYGLTSTDVQNWIEFQGGGCAICGDPEANHIDHDHDTGRVRGILCASCNRGLGQFDDSAERLRRAASYI
jgi:5-methylcytosine-specific restriction endonuclease McrA